jgi:two-component system OmpR family response regulator
VTDARHLLIIEDDESLAGLLASHLQAHGYDVTVAPSAEAAEVLFAERARPSLILLDINLPGDTGWSVLRSDAYAAAGRPPVIVASAMAVSPARLREFGVAGYLPKPFALDTLRSTLDRVLDSETREP